MMEVEAKVTSKGQITIPKVIRQLLHIAEGDTVIFDADEHGVRLRADRSTSVFSEYAGIWREGAGKTLEEINEEISDLRGRPE